MSIVAWSICVFLIPSAAFIFFTQIPVYLCIWNMFLKSLNIFSMMIGSPFLSTKNFVYCTGTYICIHSVKQTFAQEQVAPAGLCRPGKRFAYSCGAIYPVPFQTFSEQVHRYRSFSKYYVRSQNLRAHSSPTRTLCVYVHHYYFVQLRKLIASTNNYCGSQAKSINTASKTL